jgi:MFS family permease
VTFTIPSIGRDPGNVGFMSSGVAASILPLTSCADLVIANQFLYTFITVESALSLAPMFPLLAKEYHLDQTQVGLLTGVCVLALGYSNFVIVPFSNIFGRRAALILFGVITCASTIWEALAKSHGSLLGARVVNGIGTATSESIMVQVIADVFFLHERGLWMGVYL